jgi:hypothetical protein
MPIPQLWLDCLDFRDDALVAVGLELTDRSERGVTDAVDDWIRNSQKL